MTAEWPLWHAGGDQPVAPAGAATPSPLPVAGGVPAAQAVTDSPAPSVPTCPACGRPIDPAAWFCEACGNPLVPTAAGLGPAPEAGSPSTQTRRFGVRASQLADCHVCGGTVGADGYCQTCGAKAPSPRDHFSATPAQIGRAHV